MGYRTVVVLSNDFAHEWSKDPLLGQKIMQAASNPEKNRTAQGFEVHECVHADTQTLALIDGYSMDSMAFARWIPNETDAERNLKMLKEFARTMGYDLRKKK